MAEKSIRSLGIQRKEIEAFAKAFAASVCSDWERNHLHIAVSNDGDSVHMSCYGLGKMNWSKSFDNAHPEAEDYPFYQQGRTLARKLPCYGSLCIQFFCGEYKSAKVIYFD